MFCLSAKGYFKVQILLQFCNSFNDINQIIFLITDNKATFVNSEALK